MAETINEAPPTNTKPMAILHKRGFAFSDKRSESININPQATTPSTAQEKEMVFNPLLPHLNKPSILEKGLAALVTICM